MGAMISAILAFLIACVLVWVLKGDLKEQAKKTRNELGQKALLWTVLTVGTLVLVIVLVINSSMNEPFGQKTENSYYDTTHDDPYEGEYDCERDMNGVWVNNGCIREPMPGKTQEEKPITLEAEGELIVDKDIPAGRYRVTPIGQGGGFIVRDSVRRLTVNKTLDSISTGGEGYVFSCYSGDKIKTQEAVKITLVEEKE
ncbi:hypothetical protein BHV55_04945 [Bacillus sp. RZ2MS9]|uniref:hypothetical protein n=1 Tax=Bacillus sp. RZ2MS9 TaxID=1806216 RepID=UPI0008A4686F|nr:hypothetical protein [Bacillus sp. RZ2MS9]QIZ41044.1 hypothetical protein BHV55_04945 [Bacillus sp. RZ2MS9]